MYKSVVGWEPLTLMHKSFSRDFKLSEIDRRTGVSNTVRTDRFIRFPFNRIDMCKMKMGSILTGGSDKFKSYCFST
ncbi:hypothetical protein L1987_17190 [Smallanthus sonchifolius]|uniref:Uncharacterized protein n=1 Tax=Smallanthus sonchifolius TaxID=185202 RepID=A0ACB9IYP8_9ASTR|nr:hypothetical protein L1987_17190 [Smallanthus sonchifolius]